ncbi:MAG: DNA repair protein RecN [Gemmatimonadota bacterium]|nr:DNA repair protein RecN [Gemmatimonadota bacterium]
MLSELRIRDYAVVDDLTLSLAPGLNVLTGETGAGKSIIVGALSLLLGERASSSVVRTGAARATVEAVFEVAELPAVAERLDALGFRAEDDVLILRREVASEGRNRAWVNGSPATASVVGELGSALVDLHGQHEHQTLLRPREQRDILDAFAGAEGDAEQVETLYRELQELRGELEAREDRRRDVESRADFLRFQLQEIDDAALSPGEDEELEAEVARHEHAEELVRGADAASQTLYAGDDAVSDRIAEVRHTIRDLARFDPELAQHADALDEAYHLAAEVGRALGDYASSVDHDPGRLEEARQRLDRVLRLKRKYGPELADVLATAQRVREELEELDAADHDLSELGRRIEEAEARLTEAAAALSEKRRDAARRLSARITDELPALGLKDATFDVSLSPYEQPSAGGGEGVEFLVSPNPGFAPMALARVASGGELSRVMLALKATLADVDHVPVLVFDEIDAGIGGSVGSAVGSKLQEVGSRHQVFVVTHLAQVASKAAQHLLVEKTTSGDQTITATSVRPLDGEDRVAEIARMLGGDPGSKTSREHAKELLAR